LLEMVGWQIYTSGFGFYKNFHYMFL